MGKNTKRGKSKAQPEPPKPQAQEAEPVDPQEQLEFEVAWCMQQLTIGLQNETKKKSHKQETLAFDALKALSNPKTSLIKKRQLMRMHCGDYRKKMKEEEQKELANVTEPSNKTVSVPKAAFFRAKPAKSSEQTNSNTSALTNDSTEAKSGFSFNVHVGCGDSKTTNNVSVQKSEDTESKGNNGSGDASKTTNSASPSEDTETKASANNVPETALNDWKMVPTGEKVTFNFLDPKE